MSLTLFLIAAIGYAVASILFQWSLRQSKPQWKLARGLLMATLLVHTAGIVMKAMEEPHAFFSSIGKTAPTLAWFIVVLYLVMGWKWPMEVLGTFAAPSAFLLIMAAIVSSNVPAMHNAWNHWMEIHVMLIFFGFAALCLATFCALVYFQESRMLKQKSLSGSLSKLPPLESLDQWAHTLIVLGFPALGVGWLAGIINRGGVLWTGTAAETLTLLTLLLYAAYIHIRMIAGWQGLRVNLLLIVGSVVLAFTYAGVSLMPNGFHP